MHFGGGGGVVLTFIIIIFYFDYLHGLKGLLKLKFIEKFY
jgi:hypothetical protein